MPNWKLVGSSLVEDTSADVAGSAAAASPSLPVGEAAAVPAYDPSKHTVDEVKKYITHHSGEARQILDAELAGKRRQSLIEFLSAVI
jgi:hypothetical protein